MKSESVEKDNFEIAKAILHNSETIADIFSNPMIKSGIDILGEIPGIGSASKNMIEQEVARFQKRKREEFLGYIAESKELIVNKDVADVPFLMELARTLEVVDRLATNEKIIFIANLFENTFFLTEHRDIDLHEEN